MITSSIIHSHQHSHQCHRRYYFVPSISVMWPFRQPKILRQQTLHATTTTRKWLLLKWFRFRRPSTHDQLFIAKAANSCSDLQCATIAQHEWVSTDRWLRCSRRWYAPTEGRSRLYRSRRVEFRARLRSLPKTESKHSVHQRLATLPVSCLRRR